MPTRPADVFTVIYEENRWGDPESRSGGGSNLVSTSALRQKLPALLSKYGIRSMLDIPCGDFYWLKETVLPIERYIGADIVPALVTETAARYSSPTRSFMHLDLREGPLPRVDLIFCRDCLVHLSAHDTFRAIGTMLQSRSKYLLTTTFPARDVNPEQQTGDWNPINLERGPFYFPPPIELIDEQYTGDQGLYTDKSLGLWELESLRPDSAAASLR